MKIKVLNTCAGLKFSFMAGAEVDVDEAVAADLIEAGHAIPIEQPPQPERAVSPPPETATAPPMNKPKAAPTNKPKASKPKAGK